VGLPENIVKESKDRVKAAIQNSGYPFPFEKITVNLAPASLKKEGAGFDLPIAVGILAALGIGNSEKAAGTISFCSLFTHHCSLLLWAGARKARHGSRRSRIAQRSHDRSTRVRQDHAGPARLNYFNLIANTLILCGNRLPKPDLPMSTTQKNNKS
jgi:hypothetical protein